jgi:hypothetical protein
MPRGFEWVLYEADTGEVFALQVDSDYVLQPQRGWTAAAPAGAVPLPRQWLPRCVVGVEPSGRQHRAIVASTGADLWTGARADFDIVDSNGELQTCTAFKRLAESAGRRP